VFYEDFVSQVALTTQLVSMAFGEILDHLVKPLTGESVLCTDVQAPCITEKKLTTWYLTEEKLIESLKFLL